MAKRQAAEDWIACSHCGAELAADATFCPECGASDDSGWVDDELGQAIDDDFDYDEFVNREFPSSGVPSVRAGLWLAIVVGALVLLALLVAFGAND